MVAKWVGLLPYCKKVLVPEILWRLHVLPVSAWVRFLVPVPGSDI